jgi:ADP-ribose pyrophosphatase
MSRYGEVTDRPANVTLSRPKVLAKGYREYHRYRLIVTPDGAAPVSQKRDILIAGRVVVVMPIDLARQEIILLHQFRLPAHIANGRGDLVEFVAGRVEPNETLVEAARRECREEIGVAPKRMVRLLSYLTTPGLTDEEVTIFLGAVDASRVREGPRTTPDREHLHVARVPIGDAIRALEHNVIHGSPAVIGLQWLALNRKRLPGLLRPRARRGY